MELMNKAEKGIFWFLMFSIWLSIAMLGFALCFIIFGLINIAPQYPNVDLFTLDGF